MRPTTTTRDAGSGTGILWEMRGAATQRGPGSRAGDLADGPACTFTCAAWSGPAEAYALRREPDPRAGTAEAPGAPLLRRILQRKLAQWTGAYLAGVWLALQLLNVLAPMWELSPMVQQLVFLVLGLGLMPTTVVAWYHGEKGRQEVCGTECTLIAASIMASVAAIWMFCLASIA